MREVMISIQPKWCELITNGKKTVEVRKTKPKIETPFKCYVYCTKNRDMLWVLKKSERIYTDKIASIINAKDVGGATKVNGKVIGEFVCDEITGFYPTLDLKELKFRHFQMVDNSQVNMRDLYNYANGKYLYGWHISDLVIYDKPKELSEFFIYCGDNPKCDGCEAFYFSNTESGKEEYCCSVIDGHKPLKRPPQSWCYVEGAESNV